MPRILLLSVLLNLWSGTAAAAGMATHALMGEYGRRYLPDEHPLKAILTRHRPALIAGAIYPDGGYFTGFAVPSDRDVAETAHWEFFVNPLIQVLHERGCIAGENLQIPVFTGTLDYVSLTAANAAPLADIRFDDDCGAMIAFTMGVAAHGLGDEVWDALFEPQVRARGEDAASSPAFTLDAFPPGADPSVGVVLRAAIGDAPFNALREAFSGASLNSIEYSMDVIALREQGIFNDVPFLTFPPAEVLVEAYERSGRAPTADVLAVQRCAAGTRTLVLAERLGAVLEYDRVRQQMPWTSGHYFIGSGGVLHTGRMIAGYYLHLWDKLQSGVVDARGPLVVGVHPDNGERGVPIHDSPDRYVRVFISSEVNRPSVAEQPGAIALFDEDGQRVEVNLREARSLYQGDGTHGIGFEIVGNLRPNHEYTAVLTTKARDGRNKQVLEPYIWSFRTAAAP